jgi:hypothetical protein
MTSSLIWSLGGNGGGNLSWEGDRAACAFFAISRMESYAVRKLGGATLCSNLHSKFGADEFRLAKVAPRREWKDTRLFIAFDPNERIMAASGRGGGGILRLGCSLGRMGLMDGELLLLVSELSISGIREANRCPIP